MEQAKHTPGPWRVSTGLNAGFVSSESHGFVPIRTPFRNDAFETGKNRADVSDEELEANARLIAAAPELLEALEKLVGTAKLASIGDRSLYAAPVVKAAEAAIAKATGEQQ